MINLSNWDIKREIKIPNKINSDLAEIVGILTGDGCIRKFDSKTVRSTRIRVTCGLLEDSIYLAGYVIPKFKEIFNLNPSLEINYKRGYITIQFKSKLVFEFLVKNFGFGIPKYRLKVPHKILENDKLMKLYVRGLVDTDGSLSFLRIKDRNTFPEIAIYNSNKNIIKQVAGFLNNNDIRTWTFYDEVRKTKYKNAKKRHRLIVRGEDNLKKWTNTIGFSNLSKLIKIIIWEEYGYCPPHIDLFQRIMFISKKNEFTFQTLNKVLEVCKKRFKIYYDIDNIKRSFEIDQMRLLIAKEQADSSLV